LKNLSSIASTISIVDIGYIAFSTGTDTASILVNHKLARDSILTKDS